MGTIQFDIRHPNGKRESVLVEGERALVGSAAYCDVRLPMEDAAPEHLMIEAVGGTLRAEAKVDDPPALIDGMAFSTRVLAQESTLALGRVRVFVTFVPDLADRPELGAETKKEWNPIVLLALLVPIAAAVYLLLSRQADGIAPPPEKTPQLFASAARVCPQGEREQALALAEEQRDLADSKRERMPFVVSDGVAAVGHYETAAACFRASGADARAAEVGEDALSLRQNLTENFHSRRLRLSHVLKVEDYPVALKDIGVLRALTKDLKGPYVEWLARVAKQVAAKAATKKAKKTKSTS